MNTRGERNVKITFLGSAAAQGIPMPYCDCRTCAHARKHKGRNIRKRCAYMINDDLLVDMGPDLFIACTMHDVDLINTKYVLITHSHKDHFFTQNLTLRTRGFHQHTKLPPLTLVAPPSAMARLNQSGSTDQNMEIERKPILPYDRVKLAPYRMKAIKAAHFPSVGDAVNYIIDDGKKKFLIASDTGIYENEVWPHLENLQLDLLVIEATRGIRASKQTVHLSIEDMKMMVEKMKDIHAITDQTVIYATHFSHQHVPPHEKLSQLLQAVGVECVYDGLVLEI